MHIEEQKVTSVYLVGIQNQECGPELCAELLAELAELVKTLGLNFAGSEIARQREPNPKLLIGQGKAEEIAANAKRFGADAIVFDDMLSPSQQRNWEKMSGLAVIDRQEVILDIFAQHAKTKEAVLQIELARAIYSLPRLKRQWSHLNRQRGMAGGMGMRGEGEQQIEVDSRIVRMNIAKLKTQLKEVQKHREVQRRKRLNKPVPVAAIVGYTNAGKSSLLNKMTTADVLVADKLFATLDPTVRRFDLPGGQPILLADTVGFIRKLPHLLVEAFKSTLEETILADHIIEVIDASSEHIKEHHETTLNVLQELGVTGKYPILVLNKIDKVADKMARDRLVRTYPDAILCSALTGEGLDVLARKLEEQCVQNHITAKLLIPHSQHAALAKIRDAATILSENYEEDGAHLVVKIPKAAWPLAEPWEQK